MILPSPGVTVALSASPTRLHLDGDGPLISPGNLDGPLTPPNTRQDLLGSPPEMLNNTLFNRHLLSLSFLLVLLLAKQEETWGFQAELAVWKCWLCRGNLREQ